MVDQVPAPGAEPDDAVVETASVKPSILASALAEVVRALRLIRRASGRLLSGG